MILELSREAERLAVAIDPADQRTSLRALRSKSVLFCYTCNCEVIEEKSGRSSFFGREPLDAPSLVNCFPLSSYRAISRAAPLSFLLLQQGDKWQGKQAGQKLAVSLAYALCTNSEKCK